jgi:lipopolysaccharide biosynthesis glycosyltransferase
MNKLLSFLHNVLGFSLKSAILRHAKLAAFASWSILLHGLHAEEIHVAFCLNNGYALPTGVAAYSLCENIETGDHVTIHIVMTEELEHQHKDKFRQLEGRFSDKVKILIYDRLETTQFIGKTLQNIQLGIYHMAAAARLTLDKVLSKNITKVIYLDGDLLVLSSLKDLWKKLPSGGCPIAGVEDHNGNVSTLQRTKNTLQKKKSQIPIVINLYQQWSLSTGFKPHTERRFL